MQMSSILKNRLSLLLPYIALLLLGIAGPVAAQFGDDDADDLLAEFDKTFTVTDFDKLVDSHMSNISQWRYVKPYRKPKKEPTDPARWRTGRDGYVSPLGDGAAETVINVPKAQKYRIWIRCRAAINKAQPVTLTLRGANEGSHVYHAKALTNQTGKTQEGKRPICFESEAARMGTPGRSNEIWEYWEVDLKPGRTVFAVSSKSKQAQIQALFITASLAFKPSRSPDRASGNLNRIYLRVRVLEARGLESTRVSARQTYHWRRIIPPATEPLWYTTLGNFVSEDDGSTLAPGEWSKFLDISETNLGPGGYWATGWFYATGVRRAKMQLQLAWYPNDAGVIKTVEPIIINGRAGALIPMAPNGNYAPVENSDDSKGAWGIRPDSFVDWFKTTSDVNRVHQQYADNALTEVAAPHDRTPKHIRLIAECSTTAEAHDGAVAMLRQLGINTVYGSTAQQQKKHDLHGAERVAYADALFHAQTHCPTDPAVEANLTAALEAGAQRREKTDPGWRERVDTLKMGDEIGAIVSVSHINECSDCLAAFHAYLKQVTDAKGTDASFFGVADFSQLRLTLTPPNVAGVYERRLYYHCARYNFINTANFYARLTRAAEKVYPNARTYCNFSPHPPMFGGHMNGSDWFALTRHHGATLAWAEDWASRGGSWGMTGIETVSYYAALVACGARKDDLPMGFYNVASCGAADHKMFSLVAHGPFEQLIYSFGPLYAGAEGSNFWSESKGVYSQIVRGARALGPADEIIANGTREPARTALLYNRSHEIWQVAFGGYQTDRLLTFVALKQAGIPVDIVLEEDLTTDELANYDVLYIQGMNLSPQYVKVIHEWAQKGGTLIAIAGTAMWDEYNQANSASEALFGAKQRLIGATTGSWHAQSLHTHEPIDQVAFMQTDLTPAMQVDVVGVKCVLTPTAAKPVATYSDGSCAAVLNTIGKGRVLLMGVSPGLIFRGKAKGSSNYAFERRPLIVKPALAKLGKQRATHSGDVVETALFEHETGLAVTINQFSFNNHGEPATLTVVTDRDIKQVRSTLTGPLKWRRDGDSIVIEHSIVPHVDVVILQ